MAANKKAPIAVAVQNGGAAYSLHHGLAGHFRMDRAGVGICTCLGKCSDGYRDRLRPKNEVIDFHSRVCRGGPVSIRRDTR